MKGGCFNMGKVVFLVRGRNTLSGKPHVSHGTPSVKNNRKAQAFNRSTKEFRNYQNAKAYAINKAKRLGLKKVEVSGGRDIPIKKKMYRGVCKR